MPPKDKSKRGNGMLQRRDNHPGLKFMRAIVQTVQAPVAKFVGKILTRTAPAIVPPATPALEEQLKCIRLHWETRFADAVQVPREAWLEVIRATKHALHLMRHHPVMGTRKCTEVLETMRELLRLVEASEGARRQFEILAELLLGSVADIPEPTTVDEHVAHAMQNLVSGDKRSAETAIYHVRKALELAPHEAQLYCRLSECYMRAGNIEGAEKAAATAMTHDGTLTDAYLLRCNALITLGREAEAMEMCETGLQVCADCGKLLEWMELHPPTTVRTAVRADNLATFSRPLVFNPRSARAVAAGSSKPLTRDEHVAKAKKHIGKGRLRFPNAVHHIRQAIALCPSDPSLFCMLADVHIRGDEYSAAEEAASKAIALDPTCVDGYRFLCHAYEGLGRHQDALKACKTGLFICPMDMRLLMWQQNHRGMKFSRDFDEQTTRSSEASSVDWSTQSREDQLSEVDATAAMCEDSSAIGTKTTAAQLPLFDQLKCRSVGDAIPSEDATSAIPEAVLEAQLGGPTSRDSSHAEQDASQEEASLLGAEINKTVGADECVETQESCNATLSQSLETGSRSQSEINETASISVTAEDNAHQMQEAHKSAIAAEREHTMAIDNLVVEAEKLRIDGKLQLAVSTYSEAIEAWMRSGAINADAAESTPMNPAVATAFIGRASCTLQLSESGPAAHDADRVLLSSASSPNMCIIAHRVKALCCLKQQCYAAAVQACGNGLTTTPRDVFLHAVAKDALKWMLEPALAEGTDPKKAARLAKYYRLLHLIEADDPAPRSPTREPVSVPVPVPTPAAPAPTTPSRPVPEPEPEWVDLGV